MTYALSARKTICASLLIAATFVANAQECSVGLIRKMDARNSTMREGDFNMSAGGIDYLTALKQPRSAANPERYRSISIDSDPQTGKKSIGFAVSACTDKAICGKKDSQKVNYHFLSSGGAKRIPLEFNTRRYFGFRLKVFEAGGDKPTILVQLWQSAPHTPPFAMKMLPNDANSFKVVADVSNDETGSSPSAQRISVMEPVVLPLGQWIDFMIEVYPTFSDVRDDPKLPTLAIWAAKVGDKNLKMLGEYRGSWGYDVDSRKCVYNNRCETKAPSSKLDFKFGLYRDVDTQPAKVEFDTVRYTSNKESAMPRCND